MIVSTGEQVSVGLVALAIRAAGGKARSFLGHQCKIVTDSAFSRARIVSIESRADQGRARRRRDRGDRRVPGRRREGQHHHARPRRLGHHRRRDRGRAQRRRLRDLHRRRRRLHDRSQRRADGAQDRSHQLRGDARARVARREGPADPLGRARHEVRRDDPRPLELFGCRREPGSFPRKPPWRKSSSRESRVAQGRGEDHLRGPAGHLRRRRAAVRAARRRRTSRST